MCARNYMFGDKSIVRSCKNVQNILQWPITHLLKLLKGIKGNDTYTVYHLYTFQFKKA